MIEGLNDRCSGADRESRSPALIARAAAAAVAADGAAEQRAAVSGDVD